MMDPLYPSTVDKTTGAIAVAYSNSCESCSENTRSYAKVRGPPRRREEDDSEVYGRDDGVSLSVHVTVEGESTKQESESFRFDSSWFNGRTRITTLKFLACMQ